MQKIPICPCCNVRPVAINYRSGDKIYYRKKCNRCYRGHKKELPAGWVRSGYKKKDVCEKCRFKFKHPAQATVLHLDGNTENCDWINLRTVCANCAIEISHSVLGWQPAKRNSITPDF